MTKTRWRNKIKKACIAAGTYQKYYDNAIDTLAHIMELRDRAIEMYEATGSNPVTMHTNRAGAANAQKNPTFTAILDCEAQALAYWRDLGLTPAGLKRLGEKGLVNKDGSGGLADALAELGI